MNNHRRIHRIVLAFVILLVAGNAGAQSVTVDKIAGSQFCSGDPISITFTATGSWGTGNVFTLQLSNASGTFSNGFQNVGSLLGTVPGTFTITKPIGGSGSHYRFRILSSNPAITSTDNG